MPIPYAPGRAAAERLDEQALHQRHVDIQRLWKRAKVAPQGYVGQANGPRKLGQFSGFQTRGPFDMHGSGWTPNPLQPVLGIANFDSTHPTPLLHLTGLGFSIPTMATITALQFTMNKATTVGGAHAEDLHIGLTRDGATYVADNAGSSQAGMTNSFIPIYTYPIGAVNTLWNVTDWTPAQVNGPNFGVLYQAHWVSGPASGTILVTIRSLTVFFDVSEY